MKKAIILIWILSCMALIGRAQGTASYFSLCSDAQSNRVKMTVTAILDLSKTDYYYWGNSPRYQVAAFIEASAMPSPWKARIPILATGMSAKTITTGSF